jgi:hypothetical protein
VGFGGAAGGFAATEAAGNKMIVRPSVLKLAASGTLVLTAICAAPSFSE